MMRAVINRDPISNGYQPNNQADHPLREAQPSRAAHAEQEKVDAMEVDEKEQNPNPNPNMTGGAVEQPARHRPHTASELERMRNRYTRA